MVVPLGRENGMRPVPNRGIGIIVVGAMANINIPYVYPFIYLCEVGGLVLTPSFVCYVCGIGAHAVLFFAFMNLWWLGPTLCFL